MKLRQIVSGVFSGYLTKAVQFLAAISVVPFLLRSSVLGLDGYGSAFTVISFFGFLTLIVDGPRNSFTRSVSQAVGGHPEAQGCTPGAALYAGTRFLFWLCSAITVAMVASYSLVIPLIGLEANSDVLAAYVLAAAIFWVENVLYLYRVPLLARGAVDVVNYCIGFEIIFRSAVFFLYFGLFQASLASYVAITLAFVLARNLAFPIYVHWRWPSDLARSETAPVSLVAGSIRYAGPISLLSMVSTVINRLPILISHRFLGASESGLIALVVNTVRSYVIQILFSVLDQIALPVASRLNLSVLTAGARDLLWELEALYVFATGLALSATIAAMPQLILLWLGPQYLSIVIPTQVLLVGCSFEISFSIRRSLLLGQGQLGKLISRVTLSGLVGLAGVVLGATYLHNWVWMVVGVSVFPILSELFGTAVVFERSFRDSIGQRFSGFRVGAFLLGAGAVSSLLATGATSPARSVLTGLLASATALALAHVLLVPIPQALKALRKLRRSLDRDLFTAAPANVRPR